MNETTIQPDLTTREVAAILKCSPDQVRALIKLGRIKGYDLNAARRCHAEWRVTLEALNEFRFGTPPTEAPAKPPVHIQPRTPGSRFVEWQKRRRA